MPLNGRKILVAEDEPDQLNFIKTVLEDNGAEVIVAHNGSEALEMARAEIPHAMTLDINMPGMTGLELTDYLHEHSQEIPIVLITAQEEICSQVVSKPMVIKCLNKPLDAAALLQTIEDA